MKPDLRAEFADAEGNWRASLPGCLKHFLALGLKLPHSPYTHAPEPYGWGLAKVAPRDGGGYEPVYDDKAITALILPLYDTDGATVTDLLAWRSADENGEAAWWRRVGIAPMLGLPTAAVARLDDLPLLLQPTPEAWLAGEGAGVCVLDWDHYEVEFLLRAVPTLQVAVGQEAFANYLHRWLRRPTKRRFPEIFLIDPAGKTAERAA